MGQLVKLSIKYAKSDLFIANYQDLKLDEINATYIPNNDLHLILLK